MNSMLEENAIFHEDFNSHAHSNVNSEFIKLRAIYVYFCFQSIAIGLCKQFFINQTHVVTHMLK